MPDFFTAKYYVHIQKNITRHIFNLLILIFLYDILNRRNWGIYMAANRKIYIEFIRIFAIFMTISIHVSNIYSRSFSEISNGYFFTSIVYNAVARICVPLFFMISGAFAISQKLEPKKHHNRILKFILILVIWSFIFYIQNNGFNFNGFFNVFFYSLFDAEETSRHLWYMYALIGIYIALPFIQNMCKNLNEKLENQFLLFWAIFSGFLVIVLPIARSVTKSSVDLAYPIPLINSAYYLGYFICGHILYKRYNNFNFTKKHKLFFVATYVLSTSITTFLTCLISIKKNCFYDSFLWYKSIFVILASVSIFMLTIALREKFKNEFICKISTHTFGIYLIHPFFLNIIKWNIDITNLNPLWAVPVISLLLYLLSLVSCIIISKIPYLNKIIF